MFLLCMLAWATQPAWADSHYTDVKISPQTQVNMRFYDISASSGAALHEQLLQNAPHSSAGHRAVGKVTYQLDWQLDTSQLQSSCQLYSVKVTTKVEWVMPNWLQLSNLADNTQSSWNNFLGAMQEYEGRHKAIIQAAAKQIGSGIAGLPVEPNCQALKAAADEVGLQALEAARAQVKRYQLETANGRHMGVSMPAF